MAKSKNRWGQYLSGWTRVECEDCGETFEIPVDGGRPLHDRDINGFVWVRVPYNGDDEHLSPYCWDCAVREFGMKNRSKAAPPKRAA